MYCSDLRLCPARRRVLLALLSLRHPVAARAGCLHIARASWQLIVLFIRCFHPSDAAGRGRRPEKRDSIINVTAFVFCTLSSGHFDIYLDIYGGWLACWFNATLSTLIRLYHLGQMWETTDPNSASIFAEKAFRSWWVSNTWASDYGSGALTTELIQTKHYNSTTVFNATPLY